ncbi:hypothetical protein P3T76_015565 [Phytophthora citrophthora]|uniref:Uncharacterized protein n=1 Tax=Phytophthora citrophthora TaxID=4793 RepID=A0AAD9LA33_9STRA|nr:hypothetical protein P3T76_015565 [Phytophthora citrophthora]
MFFSELVTFSVTTEDMPPKKQRDKEMVGKQAIDNVTADLLSPSTTKYQSPLKKLKSTIDKHHRKTIDNTCENISCTMTEKTKSAFKQAQRDDPFETNQFLITVSLLKVDVNDPKLPHPGDVVMITPYKLNVYRNCCQVDAKLYGLANINIPCNCRVSRQHVGMP